MKPGGDGLTSVILVVQSSKLYICQGLLTKKTGDDMRLRTRRYSHNTTRRRQQVLIPELVQYVLKSL